MKPVIQVAGVIDQADADLLCECGVTHIGFPLRLPVHHEDVSDDEAASIIKTMSPSVKAVLITYLDTTDGILELADTLGVDVVQLHGDVDLSVVQALRTKRPTLKIWKSLVVKKNNLPELENRIRIFQDLVDAFITDTYDSATGAEGATGKTHDWDISMRLVAMSGTPVILAGGLTPGNVREAVCRVGPSGVDTHTGVEGPDGRKRKDLVALFVHEALEGFKTLRETRNDCGECI
jgi:phosphoribosylanthranilate isomerase